MIVSASRRTDVPAFYWPWFLSRLDAGYAMTRNPMNAHQLRRVELTDQAVDGFVFWTKNPTPMLDKLDPLDGRAYYFQYTITPYGSDVEPDLPPKQNMLDAMRLLVDRVGTERVVWRYDPILLSPTHSISWHVDRFAAMTNMLRGYTDNCTISFLDLYRKIMKRLDAISARTPDADERIALARAFVNIGAAQGIAISTCVEGDEYADVGVRRGRCVDADRLSRIAGHALDIPRDRNQRPGCTCAQSVDIGAYNSCPHGCAYCYANASPAAVAKHAARHDPASPFLIGDESTNKKGGLSIS